MDFILIPYISLKIANGKEVWMDAYFSKKLSERFRIASLIRSSDNIELNIEGETHVLKPILRGSELEHLVSKILEEIDTKLGEVKAKRGKDYAKWNLLRVLFIPFGWSRKIKEDEMRSALERELVYSKRILEELKPLTPGKFGLFKLKIADGKPVDGVYKKLYEIDLGFKVSFDEVVGEIVC